MTQPLNLNDESAVVAPERVPSVGADHDASSGCPEQGRYDRWFALGITIVALAPFVTAVATRAGRDYLPVQDFAVIDLRVRDVFTHDIPLVGPYSRYGWNHPGPLVYWLVAPFAALFGSPAWATQVGFVVLQVTAVVWTAIVSWRRRGLWALALWTAVVSASFVAVGPSAILEPWGPNVALPFFVLFCSLVWLVSGDDVALLPQAAAVGAFLVQTHVGYAPLVAAGVLFVVPATWRASGRRWRGVMALRPVRWSAGIAVVLWLPALIETVLHPPGNLVRVADQTLFGASNPKAGIGNALGILAAPFRPLPGWLGGRTAFDELRLVATPVAVTWLLVPALVLLGAGWLARRSSDDDGSRLVSLAGLMLVAGLLAVASVQGDLFPYLFYWRDTLAVLTGFAAVSIAIRSLARGRTSLRLAVPALGSLAVLLASVSLTHQVATTPLVFDRFGPMTQDLLDQLAAQGEPSRPVLVRVSGTPLGGVHGGLVDELARRGAPVRVDDGQPFQYGHDRTALPADVSAVWYVVEASDAASALTSVPGASVVAQHRVLSDADRDRLTTLQRKLTSQLAAAGEASLTSKLASPLVGFALGNIPGIDHADLDELARLNQKVEDGVCECAVIALPPSYAGPVPGPTS